MAIVTPLKTAAEQALVQQYADVKAELPGGPAVRKLREDAFAGFEAKGLPHRRLESWRYTDLRALLREARPLAGGAAATAAIKARLDALKLEGLRLVLVDGIFAPDLSSLDDIPEGVSVQSLSEALVSPREGLTRVLSGPSVGADDMGLALNTALMRDGVFIEIAEGRTTQLGLAPSGLTAAELDQVAFVRFDLKVRASDSGKVIALDNIVGMPNVN